MAMETTKKVRLQDFDALYGRIGAVASLLLMLILFWFIPSPKPQPYRPKKIREVNVDVVEQTEVIQEPTEPQVVQKPKQVVEAEADEEVDEEETIADTDLNLDQQAVDTEVPPPDAFIPYSNPPIVKYRPAPVYPELARKAGLEGKVFVKVFVGLDGAVKRAILLKGTAEALDKAALEASYKAQFKPAENNGQPVAVWFALTYDFTLR